MVNWELSIIELKDGKKMRYKVTRRLPEMNLSETKVFASKENAMEQLEEWLD
jgi:hypothetical protein